MNIIAFDVTHNDTLASELGFSYVSFEDVLANSDILSLHAPYNQHTYHMINMANVRAIKKGAFIINTLIPHVVD